MTKRLKLYHQKSKDGKQDLLFSEKKRGFLSEYTVEIPNGLKKGGVLGISAHSSKRMAQGLAKMRPHEYGKFLLHTPPHFMQDLWEKMCFAVADVLEKEPAVFNRSTFLAICGVDINKFSKP